MRGAGGGSVIVVKPGGSIRVGGDDVTLDGLAVESWVPLPIVIIGTADDRRARLRISGVTVTFDDSVTSGWLAVRSNFTDDLRITDCTLIKGGIQMVEAIDFHISGNLIDGANVNDNEAVHASVNSRGIITGNTFRNLNMEAVDLYTNGDRCVIANNRIENYRSAAIDVKVVIRDAPYVGGSSDQTGYSESTVITGNTIHNCNPQSNGDYYGIVCSWIDERAAPTVEIGKASAAITISSNVVSGMFTTNPLALTAVYCSGINVKGDGINVSGNVVRGVHGQGLSLWESGGIQLGGRAASPMYASGCTITGNVIEVEGSGIAAFDARSCTIAGNIIKRDERNDLAPRYGLRVFRRLSDSVITGNVIETGLGVTNGPGSSFSSVCVTSNKLTNGGVYLYGVDHSAFSGNIFTAATIGLVGASAESVQNMITGNTFLNSATDYPIALVGQSGFVVIGNSFDMSKWPILVQNSSASGVIASNVSRNQQGVGFVRYLSLSAADKATIMESGNVCHA